MTLDWPGVSARRCHRALRVARTATELAGSERITADPVAEALGYRLEVESFGIPRSTRVGV